MKKILVTAPVYSQSGYGQHARTLIAALMTLEGVDIYLNPTQWAKSARITNFENWYWCELLEKKFVESMNGDERYFDISIQVAPVHEFKSMAPINIGLTALVETDRVSVEYINAINSMTEVIVLSEFNLDVIKNSIYENIKINKTVLKANYAFVTESSDSLELELTTDFNFLVINQICERKNFGLTLEVFLDTFKNEENVGLICKVHRLNGSTIDKYMTTEYIRNVKNKFPNSKCKIYLLHGDFEDSKMKSLYTNPKIQCLVTSTRGESWGLPIFEAACLGLPVIAPDYSGYRDFMYISKTEKMFLSTKYKLEKINPQFIWEKVLIENSLWATVDNLSYKKCFLNMYKDYPKYKSMANKLKTYLKTEFDEVKVYKQYTDVFKKYIDIECEDIVVL